jgi:ABC-2 type transport system permease protein
MSAKDARDAREAQEIASDRPAPRPESSQPEPPPPPQSPPPPPQQQQPPEPLASVPWLARIGDALAFEWTKLRSVRSNYLTLLFAAVATLGSAALVAQVATVGPAARSGGPIGGLIGSFLGYAEYGILPLSVLGVLVFTSEYATGLIRTTFVAVPQRRLVLAAKAAVAGAAALITGEVLTFACFLLAQAIKAGHGGGGLSLGGSGVLRAVLAAGLFMPACVLVGVGLGAVLRSTAGAIAATVGVIYLLAALCLALPHPWNTRLGRFTLPFAAYQLVTPHPSLSLLPAAWSLLVLIAWPVVILAAAGLLLTRSDL